MPQLIRIDTQRKVVYSIAEGEFTRADALWHRTELAKHPDFRPDFSQLLDFTKVTKLTMSAKDIQDLAEDSVFSPASKRALVASSTEHFGATRMFGILRETKGDRTIRSFSDRAKALEWLGIPPDHDLG